MARCVGWRLAIGFVAAVLLVGSEHQQTRAEPVPAAPVDLLTTPVGSVDFPVGCKEKAAALGERGVAFLHHMMYANANFVFRLAQKADPDCAMAFWGEAMTHIHPLWPDRPTPELIEVAGNATARALALGGRSKREDAYIETVRAYFDGTSRSEQERLDRFEAAWRRLAKDHPQDLEAQAFFALAHMATANPSDKSYEKQKFAGKIVEEVLARVPDHPGAHHYIIHAYDYPGLAERALPVANNYGRIAPRVPHATHMMTHIYTRLGIWDKAIEWNRRSADAAWELCMSNGEIFTHYQHALDYLAYAHLQRAEDEEVLGIVGKAEALQPPFNEINRDAAAYAFAALPARYALERRDWKAAAALEPRAPARFPWTEEHDAYVAITHFARAIGNARLGDIRAAQADVAVLGSLGRKISPRSSYWSQQVEIQRLAAQAWVLHLQGDGESGLAHMREAAELEATTEKSPASPGEVLPAIELLGDMLFEQGKYADALKAYEASLLRAPRRFNSVFGAGRAAEELGDRGAAESHYAALLSLVADTASARPALEKAAKYLDRD
jgi:hypothetical protein